MGGDDAAAELQGADAVKVGMFGKIAVKRAADDRHVPRRTDVRRVVQTIGIDEMRFPHAQFSRHVVHLAGEGLDRACDSFGDGDGQVIR